MRILHLVPGLMTGGQETMLINIANEQAFEHEVFVMIINDDYQDNLIKLFDKRVNILFIHRPRSSKNPAYFAKMNWMIWKCHPDIIHSHYEKIIRFIIPMGYKFVYTIHDTTINAKDLERNKNTVAISNSVRIDVEARTSLSPKVIYNGIKTENIKYRKGILPYDRNKPFRIVQVSRLAHMKKGQHILIEALSILQDKGYTNISLDFIGDGDSRDFLQKLAKERNVVNVNFLGNKSVEYINEHLCEYNLFVQASLFEGFGLTVAEAIAAKLPVIVSRNDGPLEIIGEGKYGLAFENGSAEDCAEKIEEIINTDKSELQKRVDEAWDFVNSNFNVKMTAKNYIKFYQKCE